MTVEPFLGRGPFVTALGRTWCPAHFLCVNPSCKRELVDIGFVEEKGDLYCEYCFEQFLAPPCSKCNGKIKVWLEALSMHFRYWWNALCREIAWMPSAKNSILSASNVLIAVNCSETAHSSWKKATPIAKLIGTSYSRPSALHAGSPLKRATDGLKR